MNLRNLTTFDGSIGGGKLAILPPESTIPSPFAFAGWKTQARNEYLVLTGAMVKEKIVSALTPQLIMRIVSQVLNVSLEDMVGQRRFRNFVVARQMAQTAMRHFLGIGTQKIGDYFGNRNHATVLHAIKTVGDLCETDVAIAHDYDKITGILKAIQVEEAEATNARFTQPLSNPQ